jgi:hypothetical protein
MFLGIHALTSTFGILPTRRANIVRKVPLNGAIRTEKIESGQEDRIRAQFTP